MTVLLISLGYVVLIAFFVKKVYSSQAKLLWAPAVWCLLLYSFVNIVSPIYYMITKDASVLWGLSLDEVRRGSVLNLVFILCWAAGYVHMVSRATRSKTYTAHSKIAVQKQVFLMVIFGALAAQVWVVVQGFHYGYGQYLYAFDAEQVGALGIIFFIAGLLGPGAAAILCLQADSGLRVSWKGLHFSREKWSMPNFLVNASLWLILVGLMITGLIFGMKRGQFLEAAVLISFVFLYKGRSRNAVVLSSVAVVLVLLLSPVVDIARAGLDAGSVSGFLSAYESYSADAQTSSLQSLFKERAEKGLYPVSSYLLYERAREDGFVGLSAYPTILSDLLPRFLFPDKPYPLSVDGTVWGAPSFIVGTMLGDPGVTYWITGGGVMYWQLGWFGVVLGGFAVGMIWARLTLQVVYRPSVIAIGVYLMLVGYGASFFQSLDFVLHDLVRAFLLISPLWLLAELMARSRRGVVTRKKVRHFRANPEQ